MAITKDSPEIRNAFIDNYNNYAQGLDTKDWGMVRDCFADEVYIDYGGVSESTGSPDVARRSDDWMAVLQGVINGFDITRHIITNHRYDFSGEYPSCTAYLVADHVIFPNPEITIVSADDVVTVTGEYTNYYEQVGSSWKIRSSRLVMNYTGGNVELLGQAMEKAAALD
jgi:hypothetical protein